MSFDLKKLVRSHIADLHPYSSARDEFDPVEGELVYLDANENPFDNGVNRYPDPQQRKLKEVIAIRRGVATNQLLLGNGSDEVLDLIFIDLTLLYFSTFTAPFTILSVILELLVD